jgi:hypothetical protein
METLEKYLITRRAYPEWCCNLDPCDERMSELIETGFTVPMIERDEKGRLIVLNRPQVFDLDRMRSKDSFKYDFLLLENFLDDEMTQVNGAICVIDGSEITMRYISIYSVIDFKTVLTAIQEAFPVRIKEYHFINFPSFATKVAELVVSVLSSKMRKRVRFSKNIEEFHKYVNPKLLPLEYGGDRPISEFITNFKEKILKNRLRILQSDNDVIQISKKTKNFKDTEQKDTVTGSFRKLEID